MGKQHGGKKSLKALKKDLPFKAEDCPGPQPLPRNMKAKQRAYIMAGLKHLGAPIAP